MSGKGRLEEETVVGVAGRVGRRRPGRRTSWLAARVDERVRTEEIGDRAKRLSIEEVSNFAVAGLCKYPELQFSQFLGSAKLRLRVLCMDDGQILEASFLEPHRSGQLRSRIR